MRVRDKEAEIVSLVSEHQGNIETLKQSVSASAEEMMESHKTELQEVLGEHQNTLSDLRQQME